MRVACIVQARAGSSRLPGKVFKRVGQHAVLTHVLARAKAIPGVDLVHVTTTPDPRDDAVANLCRGAGVSWSRGQVPAAGGKNDVLEGYAVAAREVRARVVVRITSDCPLLDPVVAGSVLHALLSDSHCGYASNVDPPWWYDGCDVEAFRVEVLREARRRAGGDQREHVTSWMRAAENRVRLGALNVWPDGVQGPDPPAGGESGWSWLKLSVDTGDDLERVRRVWAALRSHSKFGWRDVVRAYHRAYPQRLVTLARKIYGDGAVHASRVESFVRGASGEPPTDGDAGPLAAAYRLGQREPAAPHERERLAQYYAMEDEG